MKREEKGRGAAFWGIDPNFFFGRKKEKKRGAAPA